LLPMTLAGQEPGSSDILREGVKRLDPSCRSFLTERRWDAGTGEVKATLEGYAGWDGAGLGRRPAGEVQGPRRLGWHGAGKPSQASCRYDMRWKAEPGVLQARRLE
jgi:hypothetical protein